MLFPFHASASTSLPPVSPYDPHPTEASGSGRPNRAQCGPVPNHAFQVLARRTRRCRYGIQRRPTHPGQRRYRRPLLTPAPQCLEKYALARAMTTWCAGRALSNRLAIVASDGPLVCKAGNGVIGCSTYAPQRYTYVRASECSLAFSSPSRYHVHSPPARPGATARRREEVKLGLRPDIGAPHGVYTWLSLRTLRSSSLYSIARVTSTSPPTGASHSLVRVVASLVSITPDICALLYLLRVNYL